MRALPTVLTDVRACTLCAPHLPLGPRPIIQLHDSARILIASQAPGRKAHVSGIPFNDPSGDRLRTWLGISREVFYDATRIAILPMGFCFPGTGPSGDLAPRAECAPAWRTTLLSRLTKLELTLVIGQYAMAYHLPGAGASVTAVVTDWKAHWPTVVPLPHPSPRNTRWLVQNPWFAQDVLPALQARVAQLLSS